MNLTLLIFLVLIAVGYLFVTRELNRRWLKRNPPGDEEYLSCLSLKQNCSALEIFQRAGQDWRFSTQKIEADFRAYLKTGEIPPYVRSYLRKHVTSEDLKYQEMVRSGSDTPRGGPA